MPKYAQALKLSLLLNLKGIVSNAPSLVKPDYKTIKAQIKKETKIITTVEAINRIICIIMAYIFDEQIKNPQLKQINCDQAVEIFKHSMVLNKPKIEKVISKEISARVYINIVNLLVQSMAIFDDNKLNKLARQASNKYTHPLINYELVKSKLDALFKRTLTEDEFHLIVELWLYYMQLAQDIKENDAFKEQLNETCCKLSDIIKSKKNETKKINTITAQLKSFNSFIPIDLDTLESIKQQNEKQLLFFNQLKKNLNLGNGNPLNTNNLEENAYFSVLFCAEALGLSAPENNKDGNSLLTFLDILLGLTEQKLSSESIRGRLSATTQKYQKFKRKTPEIEIWVTTLIQLSRKESNDPCILRAANNLFKSRLLQLNHKSH